MASSKQLSLLYLLHTPPAMESHRYMVKSQILQETEFQHNVIDAVVLVLLSNAGPDQESNIKAAGGGLPKAVSPCRFFMRAMQVTYSISMILNCLRP